MKPWRNDRPNWPTTILPSLLAIIGKASCCSRMPGDIAVRNRTASISARALRKAFSMMSSVIGSTSSRLCEGGGVRLDDAGGHGVSSPDQSDGRMRMQPVLSTVPECPGRMSVVVSIWATMAGPGMTLPASSFVTVVDAGLVIGAIDEDGGCLDPGRGRVGRPLRQVLGPGPSARGPARRRAGHQLMLGASSAKVKSWVWVSSKALTEAFQARLPELLESWSRSECPRGPARGTGRRSEGWSSCRLAEMPSASSAFSWRRQRVLQAASSTSESLRVSKRRTMVREASSRRRVVASP